jgi:hypothetical protein
MYAEMRLSDSRAASIARIVARNSSAQFWLSVNSELSRNQVVLERSLAGCALKRGVGRSIFHKEAGQEAINRLVTVEESHEFIIVKVLFE